MHIAPKTNKLVVPGDFVKGVVQHKVSLLSSRTINLQFSAIFLLIEWFGPWLGYLLVTSALLVLRLSRINRPPTSERVHSPTNPKVSVQCTQLYWERRHEPYESLVGTLCRSPVGSQPTGYKNLTPRRYGLSLVKVQMMAYNSSRLECRMSNVVP